MVVFLMDCVNFVSKWLSFRICAFLIRAKNTVKSRVSSDIKIEIENN